MSSVAIAAHLEVTPLSEADTHSSEDSFLESVLSEETPAAGWLLLEVVFPDVLLPDVTFPEEPSAADAAWLCLPVAALFLPFPSDELSFSAFFSALFCLVSLLSLLF